MHLATASRFPRVIALCCALVLAIAAAASVSASAASAASPAAGAPEVSVAPANPAYLQSLVKPLLRASASTSDGHGLGLRVGPQDFSYAQGMQIPLVSSAHERLAASATYDLRALGRVTSAKDQGAFGTCWAFASLGSLESGQMPGETLDFSEDNMVLTSGFDFPGSLYEAGGNLDMATAYLTRWGGPVYESDDAYGDGVTPPGLSARKHVQEVRWIAARGSALDNESIKNAITQFGAAYVSMGWYGSAYNAANASYCYDGTSGTNHGVLIVGWDDAYPAANFTSTPAGDGAFIVRNSWGSAWGDGGYFYASYYDTKFGRSSMMGVFGAAAPTNNYTGIYQCDPLGAVSQFGFGNDTAWFANVFTAQATASLSAVGFYTMTPGSSYEVYTGSALAAKTLSTSGTQPYMGYHTVTLPTPVAVTSGEPFIVAVKVTSPGTGWPIAMEKPYTNYSSAATAAAGQSFYSSNGSSWWDLTDQVSNANVCLKAYTTAAVIPAPTISGFTPSSGPMGTSVILTGSDLTGATAVRVHGAAAAFNVDSATQITLTVPAAATSGTIAVTTSGGSATSAASFSVTPPPAPTLSDLSPTSGPVGTTVTITGSGFTGASAVAFNGSAATFTVVSPTQIATTVPAGATSGTIAVTTPGGSATSAASFSVIPPPSVTLLAPTTGPVGTSVTLAGSGFTGASSVRFNGFPATFSVDSDTQITTAVPAGASSGTVAVTTPGGSATSAARFIVIPTPTLRLFSPATGPAGTVVTLTGSGFTGATTVAFNGHDAADFTVVSATRITATVPAGATSGSITVTTPGGSAASSASFGVVPAPSITSFAPSSGAMGAAVTITGSGFIGTSAVTFGDVEATFTVVSSTQMTATVPAGATSAPIAITAAGGMTTSTASFSVIPQPSIVSFTPDLSPVGTRVTLAGSGFTGATAVTFNGRSAAFTVVDSTKIRATVPSRATAGPIAVTTAGGTTTSEASFTPVPRSKVTLKLKGLKSRAMKRRKTLTATGKVTPASLVGGKVKLTVQRKRSGKWVTAKTRSVTIKSTQAYRWKYKPTKRGTYRVRAAVTKTAVRTAAKTKWLTFKVK